MPEEPFSILDKIEHISSSGFKRFLIDFSKTKVSKNQIKAINTSMSKALPLPDVSRFNWKDGFYSPQQIEEYKLQNERAKSKSSFPKSNKNNSKKPNKQHKPKRK